MAAINLNLNELAIEDEDTEFIQLLLANAPDSRRKVTYNPAWPRFNLAELTDDQCLDKFRFKKDDDIYRLSNLLGVPESIQLKNASTCNGIDTVCVLLRRFAYPNRLSDLEELFGRPKSTLSLIINQLVDFLYTSHHHRFLSLDNPWLDAAHLQLYADTIHNKGAPLQNCIGFVDGTVRPICRPTRYQRVCFNGHRRIHALKFQSVVIPCGLITHLYGPVEGRRHDSALLRISGLMEQFEARDFTDRNGIPYALYGDTAYPLRRYLISPFRGANLRAEEEFNTRMSSVRECVEWEFGKMLKIFAFLDFRKNLKVLLSPVAKYYLVGGLLNNCHTCLYGNQTSKFFQLEPPSLEDYLA